MPPPTPRWVHPVAARAVHGEGADRHREVGLTVGRAVSIQPNAPQYTPRRTGSSSSMALQHPRLGRAGDRRGRERGARRARRRRRRRAAARAPCSRGGAARGGPPPRTARARAIDAGDAHPPEVVAGEVDDHHVLGVVLRARPQPPRVGWPAAVPLIGRVSTWSPRPAQEPLGRRRHHRERVGQPGAEPAGGAASPCGAPGGGRASAACSATGSSAPSHVSRRVRFTW